MQKFNFPLDPLWTDEQVKAKIIELWDKEVKGAAAGNQFKLDVRMGAILVSTEGNTVYSEWLTFFYHCDMMDYDELYYAINTIDMSERYPGPKAKGYCQLGDIVCFSYNGAFKLTWRDYPRIGHMAFYFPESVQQIFGLHCTVCIGILHPYVRLSTPLPATVRYNTIVYSDQLHLSRLGDSDSPYLAVCPMWKRWRAFAQGKSPWFLDCTFPYHRMYKSLMHTRLEDIHFKLRDVRGQLMFDTGLIFVQMHFQWRRRPTRSSTSLSSAMPRWTCIRTTSSPYTTNLAHPLVLDGKWEVALHSCSYHRYWLNVGSDFDTKFTVLITHPQKGRSVYDSFLRSPGNYLSMESILSSLLHEWISWVGGLRQIRDFCDLSFNDTTQLVSLTWRDPRNLGHLLVLFCFSHDMAQMLGPYEGKMGDNMGVGPPCSPTKWRRPYPSPFCDWHTWRRAQPVHLHGHSACLSLGGLGLRVPLHCSHAREGWRVHPPPGRPLDV